jgi:hypothetical protein
MATAACMSLVLTMIISSCGLAFCSDPELISSPVIRPLDPACRWGYITETCCQSGGGAYQLPLSGAQIIQPSQLHRRRTSEVLQKGRFPSLPRVCDKQGLRVQDRGLGLRGRGLVKGSAPVGLSRPDVKRIAQRRFDSAQDLQQREVQAQVPR